jgi:hypothetical protein
MAPHHTMTTKDEVGTLPVSKVLLSRHGGPRGEGGHYVQIMFAFLLSFFSPFF